VKPHDNADLYAIEIVPEGEIVLLFSSADEKSGRSGRIGHLRTDFGRRGMEFWSNWFDHCDELKTQQFKDEFDAVIMQLREDGNMLNSLSALKEYCYRHREAKLESTYRSDSYGFKIVTEAHCYYIRGTLAQGDYNVYCYCYDRCRLEQCLAEAKAAEIAVNKERVNICLSKLKKEI
jgi:hypothetical protein